MTLLCTMLLLSPWNTDLQVEGLRDGEQYRSLASSPEVNWEVERYGRVVDATSGQPISGAFIETWTEEINGPGQGSKLIGQTRTARDGNFRVSVRKDGVKAEKIRVRAAGYLAYPGTLGDLEFIQLVPMSAYATSVRVVDLEDRPIARARITSTYSCAHDVPAFEVLTDERGIAVLHEYGLQDHMGELRVHAEGFRARKYVSWSYVVSSKGGSPGLIRLAKQSPLSVRMLDREGAALSEQTMYLLDGDGYHAPVADEEGLIRVPSRYDTGELVLYRLSLDANDNEFIHSTRFPSGRVTALRIQAEDWPAEERIATLRWSHEYEKHCPVNVFHKEGWALNEVSEDGSAFPVGSALFLIGGPFSGYEEQVHEVELVEGQEFALPWKPVPEPELEVLAPEDVYRIYVQVGEKTLELSGRESQTITVPAGRPITLLAEGDRTRRLVMSGIRSASIADLRPEGLILPATQAQLISEAAHETLQVRISTDSEAALGAIGSGDIEVVQIAPDLYEVTAPSGYPLLLSFSKEGYVDLWRKTHAGAGTVQLDPIPCAKITFLNETGAELELDSIEPDRIEQLNPGPMSVIFRLSDGRRGMISVVLAPGEHRQITLRN